MSNSVGPLRTARLVSLALAWISSVIAASVGLNALVKSNQSKSHIKAAVAAPTVVTINTSDILDVGIVATALTAFISVLIFNFIAAMFLPFTRAFSTRTLRLQAIILVFCSAWLLACMIPFMLFFATRSAEVRAFVGTTELPHALIQKLEASMGSTSVYSKLYYLKLLAAFPWLSFVSTTIASVVLFVASSRVTKEIPVPDFSHSSQPEVSEKESIEQKETV